MIFQNAIKNKIETTRSKLDIHSNDSPACTKISFQCRPLDFIYLFHFLFLFCFCFYLYFFYIYLFIYSFVRSETKGFVRHSILCSHSKTFGLDVFYIPLLECPGILLPCITAVVNKFLPSAVFPPVYNSVLVEPLFKKLYVLGPYYFKKIEI